MISLSTSVSGVDGDCKYRLRRACDDEPEREDRRADHREIPLERPLVANGEARRLPGYKRRDHMRARVGERGANSSVRRELLAHRTLWPTRDQVAPRPDERRQRQAQ